MRVGPDLTRVVVVLDRSGSMADIRDDVVGGFNAFIQKQQELNLPGRCLVSLLQFDSEAMEWMYRDRDLHHVPPLEFTPRGLTPLLDAIGASVGDNITNSTTCSTCGRERFPLSDAPNTLVIIITDGLENASRTFTKKRVRELIERRKRQGWEFLYLAANVDAFHEAGQIGLAQRADSWTSSPVGTANLFNAVTTYTTEYRTTGTSGTTTGGQTSTPPDKETE